MEETMLSLEEKCLLLLRHQNNKVTFFCDGLSVLKALFQLQDIGKIDVEDIFLELGHGDTYKCWQKPDFVQINTFLDLLEIFETLPSEIFILHLNFNSQELKVSIYDDRDFTLSSDSFDIIVMYVEKLLKNNLSFSDEISSRLMKVLRENNDKYILINTSGEVVSVYNDFDEYLFSIKN